MLMFYIKKFMFEIKFQQNINSKSEYTFFFICSQMCTLINYVLTNFPKLPRINENYLNSLKMIQRFVERY